MKWYDFFSLFYDRALEDRYIPYRSRAFAPQWLGQGSLILDLACGTGQNFSFLHNAFGENSQILGVDFSKGMLKRARKRVEREGWKGITCIQKDVVSFSADDVQAALGEPQVDAIVCALGFTAFPHWNQVFTDTFSLLKPGGRYVIFDVHAEERNAATRQVELVARADILRRVWEPLELVSSDFSMEFFDNPIKEFGGRLFVASGSK